MADNEVCVEVDGIPVAISRDAMDDIDVLEMLADVSEGSMTSMPRLMRSVLGDEQYANVKESLKGDDGRTRVSDMTGFFFRAWREVGQAAKN